MAAIYTAITEQQIIYSTIPASFEEYGQRVRLADSVMAQNWEPVWIWLYSMLPVWKQSG